MVLRCHRCRTAWARVDANGKGAILHQSCRNLVLIRADGLPAANESHLLRRGCLALAVLGRVRVGAFGLKADLVLDHVLESVAGQPAAAALVTRGFVTIHQLLLTE